MNKKIFIVAGSLLVPFIFAFASQAAEDQPSDAKASNKAEHDKKAAKKAKKAAPSVKSSAPTSRSVSPPSDGATSDDPVGGMPGHNSGSDQKQP